MQLAGRLKMKSNYLGSIAPIPKAPKGDVLTIAGWALDPNGNTFDSIVLKCGKEAFKAQIKIPRSDVAQTYPELRGSSASGYEILVNLSQLSGNIKAELLGFIGATKSIVLSNLNFM